MACAGRGDRRASPCRVVPLFLTPVSVRMVHAALCNADADEGKVPFSARVSGFPLPRATLRVPVCHFPVCHR